MPVANDFPPRPADALHREAKSPAPVILLCVPASRYASGAGPSRPPPFVATKAAMGAASGQTVCRSGRTITVDGIEMGTALERDRIGRELPAWQGCRRIQTGEVFLMNWQVRDSLDGRYFGLTSTDQIIGHAVPLWTDEDGRGRFEWRAPTR
jgi:type IV secretory pathway protease TraF